MYEFQLSFFWDIQVLIQRSNFYRKYFLLFSGLPLKGFPDKNHGAGCTGYSRHAILRALIVKNLEEIKSIPRLIEFLDAHPILTELCGFAMGKIPDETQFYRFLKKTKNSSIEDIHIAINRKLLEAGILSLDTLILDSKPVMAATRENNFKNPKRNTTDKTKIPTRNPNASLSYYSYQNISGKKDNFIFFWGYRTHVIVSKEGIPIIEKTLPNNKTDEQVAKKLISKLKRIYGLKEDTIFIADAAYDVRDFYNFIVNNLKGQAFIPINPRNQKADKVFGSHGCPICEANLEMTSNGSWTEGLRTRMKFRCPLKMNSTVKEKYPAGCPINHPRFLEEPCYGCTKYLDITDDPRSRVPRDAELYKNTYKKRQTVEQYFARLGDREAEQTTHYRLRAVQNQMTIAHLSMSLVAYAAAIIIKRPDKIRCYRTFANETLDIKIAA
ncbi:MAG: transposase [bacterium]